LAPSALAYHSNSAKKRSVALSIQGSLDDPSSVSAVLIVGIERTDGTLGIPISARIVLNATAARTPPKRLAE